MRGWNFILSLPVCKKRDNTVMGWEQGKDNRMKGTSVGKPARQTDPGGQLAETQAEIRL